MEPPTAPAQPIELPELGWRMDFSTAYSMRKWIGSGANGQVGMALDTQTGQEVAVRTLPKVRRKLSRELTMQKIRTEVAMFRRVQGCHGVVRLIECFEDAESVQFVTEICRGGDLRRYVEENGTLNERALALVAVEVLKFLKACHTLGIFYGDIKPANFCLVNASPFGQLPSSSYLKAIDFGSSQEIPSSTRLTQRGGTPVFMAPEVYAQSFSEKAEVWSLGVMLYWLFSRRLPFWESGAEPALPLLFLMAEAVNNAAIKYDHESWAHMSAEGIDFISGCLTRPEAERLSVDDALAHPWVAGFAAEGECTENPCVIPITGTMDEYDFIGV